MKNSGLMAVIFFSAGLLLLWGAATGRNPIRVIREVLTNGAYNPETEYRKPR